MRVLVAIAHHGSKNRDFLLRMLESFRSMDHEVDVVVLCEERKDLPADVEQLVGVPTDDPWSLPFAHRPVFAERRDAYDLFVYSEDDTLIEQRHLDAYLELDEQLPDDLIPGFMRFEVAPGGGRSYCTIHSYYRWDPASAFRCGELSFARFTNDHSACFALTRAQLGRAIASGGFLVAAHQGRYDMLVSAATDVYTNCGFHKVLCMDRIEDQLVHHMPNVYLGKMGIGEQMFREQIDELRALANSTGPTEQLLRSETRMQVRLWDRHTYPRIPPRLSDLLPREPSRILTVGATSGDLEHRILASGHEVVAVPLDPVFARTLDGRGIERLRCALPTSDELRDLGHFRLVLLPDVLPYLPDPVLALGRLRAALTANGCLVATAPDHRRYRLRNRVPGAETVQLPRAFGVDGVHRTDGSVLRRWFRSAGFDDVEVRHRAATRNEPVGSGGGRARVLGNTILVQAAAARFRA